MTESLPTESLATELSATFADRVRRQEPLAGHTMLQLGGPADIWLAVESAAELVEAVTLARQHHIPVFMLGGGANVLISDAGIRGLVIENRARGITYPAPDQKETVILSVESGVMLPGLAQRCARRGLSGLEWAIGVPGTIGGTIVNNAGAYGSDMAHMLIRAKLLSPGSETLWQPAEWFQYGYRRSRLKQKQKAGWVVLQAELQMKRAPVADIQTLLMALSQRRKANQPPGATIGSMFKNPTGDYAGRLIDAVGLKGHKVGQAQISALHANFFQNVGGATATDMMALIEITRQRVKAKFGITLELEIEIIGTFNQET